MKARKRMALSDLLESANTKPLHEALNYAPSHDYGIPAWFGDPDNPPVFESQHAYLKRHGLLLPAERRSVTEPYPHPLRIEGSS
jgi:hypothetical protein